MRKIIFFHFYFPFKYTWFEAFLQCSMKKLSLVTLETQEEYNDLAKILKEEPLYVDVVNAIPRIVNVLQFYCLLAPIVALICGLVLLE